MTSTTDRPAPPQQLTPNAAPPDAALPRSVAPRGAALPASRLLLGAAAVGIVSSDGVMVLASFNPDTWFLPRLPLPVPGPPWDVPSVHLSLTSVTIALWLAALAGGGGMAAGVLAIRRGARVNPYLLIGTGAFAVALLTVLPPVGSTDILDYAAFGHMATLGHSPYVWTPIHLRYPGSAFGSSVPINWDRQVTPYGPLATFEQYVAAVLGGASAARIAFWLKLCNAIAFLAVALLADRMLRADPARRLRAHVLWTVNPLLLWVLIASGHIDMIAAGFGLVGLLILDADQRTGSPTLARASLAGFLFGVCADIKISYILLAIGAAWTLRRRAIALCGTAGATVAVLVPTYLWCGPPSVYAVLHRSSKASPDTIYQLFSRLNGFVFRHLVPIALVGVVILAVLAARRLPRTTPPQPALRATLVLSLAWLFVWPYQLPWYDAMIVCPLIFFPASRLDWLLIGRLTAGTIAVLPGAPMQPTGPAIVAVDHAIVRFWSPLALLACAVGLAYLCATGRWRTNQAAAETSTASNPMPASA